jgi:hypothetical protein
MRYLAPEATARVLPAREGENTHDEQLWIAKQIKKDVIINQ